MNIDENNDPLENQNPIESTESSNDFSTPSDQLSENTPPVSAHNHCILFFFDKTCCYNIKLDTILSILFYK